MTGRKNRNRKFGQNRTCGRKPKIQRKIGHKKLCKIKLLLKIWLQNFRIFLEYFYDQMKTKFKTCWRYRLNNFL